jgi:hypothetical protein
MWIRSDSRGSQRDLSLRLISGGAAFSRDLGRTAARDRSRQGFALAKPDDPATAHEGTTTDCAAAWANQAWLGPVLPAKINRFAITPNHSYNSAIPHPLEGRIAIVTDVGRGMRWTRQRRARKLIAGRASACERQQRRADDRRLNASTRTSVWQHTGRSKHSGRGSRGRQSRVVLAPVAGVKLAEIDLTQPGLDRSSICQ